MKDFKREIAEKENSGLLRKLGATKGRIDFLSNDYLGLSRKEFAYKGSNGSTGSRLLSGNSAEIERLEAEIATFHSTEKALLFTSGYSANLGVLGSIATRNDTFIMDELCHASLIDGARLSNAKRLKFKHNKLGDLENKLVKSTGHKFVVIESIYSMDGTAADVKEVVKLCKTHDAVLIIDEAHSCGIWNNVTPVNSHNTIRIITYGKAFGSHGAAVLCNEDMKHYLINHSRPFIYSTAPSPHQVAGIAHCYELMTAVDSDRKRLLELINYWNTHLPQTLDWIASTSQIQSLLVPGNEHVIALANYLQENDISVLPIRTPTVKRGSERIRFCLHSYNSTQEIDHLFSLLNTWKKSV